MDVQVENGEKRRRTFSVGTGYSEVNAILDAQPDNKMSQFICEAILHYNEVKKNPQYIEEQLQGAIAAVTELQRLLQLMGKWSNTPNYPPPPGFNPNYGYPNGYPGGYYGHYPPPPDYFSPPPQFPANNQPAEREYFGGPEKPPAIPEGIDSGAVALQQGEHEATASASIEQTETEADDETKNPAQPNPDTKEPQIRPRRSRLGQGLFNQSLSN